jgi:4'-phosphopantetheinyl transferase
MELLNNEIHVWRIPLDVSDQTVDRLRSMLSIDEIGRSIRYRFDHLTRRFIAGRAGLRVILGAYLNRRGGELRFDYGPLGKPILSDDFRGSRIEFNVSHSHEMALCAVTRSGEIGVDLEYIRELRDSDGLAERFFARSEIDTMRRLSADERVLAFLRCWTRKEALLKAVGTGLSKPLREVEVSLARDEPCRAIRLSADFGPLDRWWLTAITPGPLYIGAIALRGTPRTVRSFQFPLDPSW